MIDLARTAGATAPAPSGARRQALLHLTILLALAAIRPPGLSPNAVVAGGPLIKLLFLGRMAVLLGVATWFLRLQGVGWSSTGLRRPSWSRLLVAVPLGTIAGAVCVGAVRAALRGAGVRAADYSVFAPLHGDLGQYLFWAIPVALGTAAFGEELLFRGFVLRCVEMVLGGPGRLTTGAAVLLQALIFGALHIYQGLGGAASAGVLGLVLGLVWLLTGRNLWAGIVIHGFFDVSAMTAIYLGGVPPH